MNALQISHTIRDIQATLLAMPNVYRVNPPVEHEFLNGLYMRKCVLPGLSLIVGATHKLPHILIINRGGGIMVNEKGKFKVKQGDVISNDVATKRLFKADGCGMELITIHPNPKNITDIKELEKELVEYI